MRRLTTCFLTLTLALSLGSGLAAAGALRRGLVPIPWKDAGFEHEHPQVPALSIRVCDASFDCEEVTPEPVGRVVVDLLGAHLEFDPVSRIMGNHWEFGYENIVLDPGGGVDSVYVTAVPRASFDVPIVGGAAVTHVAYVERQQFNVPESELGFSDLKPYVAGDTVHRLPPLSWGLDSLASGSPQTSCQFASQPGVVLDDCIDDIGIWVPTAPRRHHH